MGKKTKTQELQEKIGLMADNRGLKVEFYIQRLQLSGPMYKCVTFSVKDKIAGGPAMYVSVKLADAEQWLSGFTQDVFCGTHWEKLNAAKSTKGPKQ